MDELSRHCEEPDKQAITPCANVSLVFLGLERDREKDEL